MTRTIETSPVGIRFRRLDSPDPLELTHLIGALWITSTGMDQLLFADAKIVFQHFLVNL